MAFLELIIHRVHSSPSSWHIEEESILAVGLSKMIRFLTGHVARAAPVDTDVQLTDTTEQHSETLRSTARD